MSPLLYFCSMVLLASASTHAGACSQPNSGKTAHQPHWAVDHYVYDASLKRDWAVLVDLEHPDTPARMKLLPRNARMSVGASHSRQSRNAAIPEPHIIAVKAGTAVEVSSAPNAPARIRLAGTAMQTALAGQAVRVRLDLSGHFVRGIVLGPNSVELASAAQVSWGKP